MASCWQQMVVYGGLVVAVIYLVVRFLRDRKRPKCNDCALGQMAGKGRSPRP